MPSLEFRCSLDAPIAKVWEFHDSIETLFLLTPPNTTATLDGSPEPMREGVIYKLKLKRWGILPLPTWHAKIVVYCPPTRFEDEQIPGKGPFKAWHHTHRFEAIDATHTLLIDEVTYTPPFGILGEIADALLIRRDIKKMFAYRHEVTKRELAKK